MYLPVLLSPTLLNPHPGQPLQFPPHVYRSPSFHSPPKKTKTNTKSYNLMPIQLVLASFGEMPLCINVCSQWANTYHHLSNKIILGKINNLIRVPNYFILLYSWSLLKTHQLPDIINCTVHRFCPLIEFSLCRRPNIKHPSWDHWPQFLLFYQLFFSCKLRPDWLFTTNSHLTSFYVLNSSGTRSNNYSTSPHDNAMVLLGLSKLKSANTELERATKTWKLIQNYLLLS